MILITYPDRASHRGHSQIDGDLDKLNWDMVGKVEHWRA
jgi:hypothetical protein